MTYILFSTLTLTFESQSTNIQLNSVNPDLCQNQIKLVIRMISNVFLYKNFRFILDFLIRIFTNSG